MNEKRNSNGARAVFYTKFYFKLACYLAFNQVIWHPKLSLPRINIEKLFPNNKPNAFVEVTLENDQFL